MTQEGVKIHTLYVEGVVFSYSQHSLDQYGEGEVDALVKDIILSTLQAGRVELGPQSMARAVTEAIHERCRFLGPELLLKHGPKRSKARMKIAEAFIIKQQLWKQEIVEKARQSRSTIGELIP